VAMVALTPLIAIQLLGIVFKVKEAKRKISPEESIQNREDLYTIIDL